MMTRPAVTPPSSMWLGDRLENRAANNFDLLRFLAAGCVILSHCFSVLGLRYEPLFDLTGYEGFGQLGVSIFFFMSGFLVTRSWAAAPSAYKFTVKRCARIFPGTIASALFCVFIIGPMSTRYSLEVYFTKGRTYLYLLNGVWPGCTYYLSCFAHNPLQEVNGSLWTLPLEFRCCVIVLLCGRFKLLNPAFFPLAAAAALGIILKFYVQWLLQGGDIAKFRLQDWDSCYLHFLLGAAAYVYRKQIPVNRWIALSAASLYLATLSTDVYGYAVSLFTVPYLVLYIAQAKVFRLSQWAKYGDLSFGMYIYAFPIQQIIVHFAGSKIGVSLLFSLTMLLTIAVAFFYWHLVERPVLALSKRLLRQPVAKPELDLLSLAQPAL